MSSSDGTVALASRIADEALFPSAQDIDRSPLIPRSRFAVLAEAGLFGLAGPANRGHLDLAPSQARRVIAAIAGGCGATFFCWVQHHGVVRTVRSTQSDSFGPLLERLCDGTTMAGVAFAHLRRADRRAVTARRVEGGWSFDGHAPWATSWGIADVFAVAAESEDGQVVWGLIPGVATDSVRPTMLALPVFASTGTVALDLRRCAVADDAVIGVEDAARWRDADRHRAAIGQTAALGVSERALRLLGATQRGRDDAVGSAVAALRDELDRAWRRDDDLLALLAAESDDDIIDTASDHRADCLDLGRRATTALLASSGGGAMDLSHPAQRLAREALFYVVQAQTSDGRAATLRRSAERAGTVDHFQHRGET